MPPDSPPPGAAPVVEVHGLTKRFADITAVSDVSFSVERGSVFGVLGPNGSGKSTTVRMILGLARPDAGNVRLFGEELTANPTALLRRVGAVVEAPAFVPYLSGRDNLRLLDRYVPCGGEPAIQLALERVEMLESADRRFKNYSLGMKQRLGVAASILHDPELVILDEPTNGLDPKGTREMRALIPRLAAEGKTVVLCSHLLHEVEQVCDQIAIFQRGRIIAHGATHELVSGGAHLEVEVDELDAARAALASRWDGAVSVDEGRLLIAGASREGKEVNQVLAAAGIYARSIHAVQPTLEDVFLKLTGEPADA
jgi:ABC-2 type transport system ATP-binding protein